MSFSDNGKVSEGTLTDILRPLLQLSFDAWTFCSIQKSNKHANQGGKYHINNGNTTTKLLLLKVTTTDICSRSKRNRIRWFFMVSGFFEASLSKN